MKFTDDNYKDILAEEGKLSVIDFWATWCGPCKRLSPIVEKVAEQYEGKANIGACNVENNELLTEAYAIRNIPTLVFIKDGKELERVGGAINELKLKELVEKYL